MALSTNMISGLSSGFDWRSMIDQLMAVEKRPVQLVQQQVNGYETKLKEWQSFNTQLLSLKGAAAALSSPDDFNLFTSAMSSDNSDVAADDILSVSANSSASVGSYDIIVNSIATAQKVTSSSFSSGTNALGSGYAGDIIINGKSITISETDGLNDIQNKINNSNAGVTAGLIKYSDTDYRLNLTSDTTGAEGISLENGSASDLVQLMGWKDSEGAFNEIVAGKDASFSIDGVAITRDNNTIDDVLTGVTLKLKGEDAGTTITMNIERDTGEIEKKLQTFVEAYNSVASYIKEQQTYNQDDETTGGVLFGDGTLSSVKSDLTSLLVEPIWGVSSEFSIMGLAGINVDSEGQLSIDSEVLGEYLESNFSDIQKLFTVNGSSSSGNIEYIYSTNDTKAGNYAVEITQAATQSSSAATSAVDTTLGTNQSLTITSGNNTAVVSLTSDMTISDIVAAVNTKLNSTYTEKLAGDTEVTAGAAAVTSATTWGAIDGGNLVDGDTISFSGTDRNGKDISGSYTIASASSNTIQGFLAEIEASFENDVSASIDDSGRLVIMDKEEGASSLSFTLDYSGTQNKADIFGSVLATNTGGQEGKSSMAITASNDGSNHLKLSSDDFGSGYSFTVDSALWSGSPVTVNNGQDVAGTINGEIATGKGQALTGDSEAENTAGLVIRYTGSSTGNAGNIKFTTGIGELFDRALFKITDSYEGYVTFKQDSLSENIKNLETRMDDMNQRLDLKMEAMVSRFVAMEMALSKMQSQSQWLSSQLSAASLSWG